MTECLCPTCGAALPPYLFAVDPESQIIVGNGRFAYLTSDEFAVFDCLYQARPRVLTKEQLLEAVTSFVDDAPEIKIVDVYVCKIRKKLAGLGVSIETIWGSGYRMLPRSTS